jgi:hypothetical protein
MLSPSLIESAAPSNGALRRPPARSAKLRVKRHRPAARAASQTFAASVAVGVLGLAWAGFVLARLLGTWRISTGDSAHEIVVLGQRVSYPAANAAAIAVLALAALGLLVLALAVRGAARELLAARRFCRGLAAYDSCRIGDAWVTADARVQAFCVGWLRPRVYVSRGALELLDAHELDAVLAHERHHATRRDPLRLACGRVLADALFFLPALRATVASQQALAEIGADEAAVLHTGGDRSALARAMLGFSDSGAGGLDPDRVDFLLGDRPHLRFSLTPCVGVASVLCGLLAAGVLAGQAAAGSLTLSLPFLSAQPCVVVLASIPLCVSAVAVTYCRRRARVDA